MGCWETDQIELHLPAVAPVSQEEWQRDCEHDCLQMVNALQISQQASVSQRVLVCMCQVSRLMCLCVCAPLFLLGSEAIQASLNFPAWNTFVIFSSGVHIRVLILFSQNMLAKQRKAHMAPANNKTCLKGSTKPFAPASPHFTKDVFDVVQNNFYLSSVCPSYVYELYVYSPWIDAHVCYTCVCMCDRSRFLYSLQMCALNEH